MEAEISKYINLFTKIWLLYVLFKVTELCWDIVSESIKEEAKPHVRKLTRNTFRFTRLHASSIFQKGIGTIGIVHQNYKIAVHTFSRIRVGKLLYLSDEPLPELPVQPASAITKSMTYVVDKQATYNASTSPTASVYGSSPSPTPSAEASTTVSLSTDTLLRSPNVVVNDQPFVQSENMMISQMVKNDNMMNSNPIVSPTSHIRAFVEDVTSMTGYVKQASSWYDTNVVQHAQKLSDFINMLPVEDRVLDRSGAIPLTITPHRPTLSSLATSK